MTKVAGTNFVSKNSYELLSDYGDLSNKPVCVDVGRKTILKETGYNLCSTTYQPDSGSNYQQYDDFDDDIDEHIELPEDV